METVHNPFVPSATAQRIDTTLAQVAESRVGGPMLFDMASVAQDALESGIKVRAKCSAPPRRVTRTRALTRAHSLTPSPLQQEEGLYTPGEDEAVAEASGGGDAAAASADVPFHPAVEKPSSGFEEEWAWLQALHAEPREALRNGFNFEQCHYPSARYIGSVAEILRYMKADMVQNRAAGTFAVLKCECVLHPMLAARFEVKWAEMRVRAVQPCLCPPIALNPPGGGRRRCTPLWPSRWWCTTARGRRCTAP